jgi:iron-sulfur cluster assembly protein
MRQGKARGPCSIDRGLLGTNVWELLHWRAVGFGHPTAGTGVFSMIDVTSEASERIHALLSEDGKLESHGLRMKVIGGGCSGLQYQLSFDDMVREIDTEILIDGIKLIVDEKSALYLVGSRLNFVDTLEESGFKIENPNASNTCGCGQSFAA